MEARELLTHLPFLRVLPSLQLAHLAQQCTLISLRAGQPIHALMAGAPPLLYLAKGRVIATESLLRGRAERTFLRTPGQWLNLGTLPIPAAEPTLPSAPLDLSITLRAKSLTPTQLVALDGEFLQGLLPLNPTLTLHIARYQREELVRISALLAAHSTMALPERLLFHLRLLSQQLNGPGQPFTLPFPQRVLAAMVGCSREALARTLRALIDQGRIFTQGECYILP